MGYVALSRVKSLEGLSIKNIDWEQIQCHPKAIEFYKRLGYSELGAIYLKPNKNEYYCFEKILL